MSKVEFDPEEHIEISRNLQSIHSDFEGANVHLHNAMNLAEGIPEDSMLKMFKGPLIQSMQNAIDFSKSIDGDFRSAISEHNNLADGLKQFEKNQGIPIENPMESPELGGKKVVSPIENPSSVSKLSGLSSIH